MLGSTRDTLNLVMPIFDKKFDDPFEGLGLIDNGEVGRSNCISTALGACSLGPYSQMYEHFIPYGRRHFRYRHFFALDPDTLTTCQSFGSDPHIKDPALEDYCESVGGYFSGMEGLSGESERLVRELSQNRGLGQKHSMVGGHLVVVRRLCPEVTLQKVSPFGNLRDLRHLIIEKAEVVV